MLIREGIEDLMTTAIGDVHTDKLTRQWLSAVFRDLGFDKEHQCDRIIEVMAGWGRNVPVYKDCFRFIELLDGSDEMVAEMPTEFVRHKCLIQNFLWPKSRYDCILGVFCLCYLHGEDLDNVLLRMQASVKTSGFIVLMEPVLREGSQADENKIAEPEAQMKARKSSSYTRLFQRFGLRVMDTRFYKRAEWLLTPIKIYILQAGLRK
jgi:hypothetical protein